MTKAIAILLCLTLSACCYSCPSSSGNSRPRTFCHDYHVYTIQDKDSGSEWDTCGEPIPHESSVQFVTTKDEGMLITSPHGFTIKATPARCFEPSEYSRDHGTPCLQ